MSPEREETAVAYQISDADNVATMLSAAAAGESRTVVGAGDIRSITTRAPVQAGHKIAVRTIAKGEDVVKYGVPIGYARADIHPGDWVHLHNCASHFDERSSTLDRETGAATDRRYE